MNSIINKGNEFGDLLKNNIKKIDEKSYNINFDEYQIKLKSYSNKEIVYEVALLNSKKSFIRVFTLIKEDNMWKIGKAFYRDKCMLDYYIS